jgi:transcriptional regulator with XRE-family HTH domain
MTQQQLADQISVSKRQIIKYEGNQKTPPRGHLLLWQMVTRVPAEWIETGSYGTTGGPDGGGVTSMYRFPGRRNLSQDSTTPIRGSRRMVAPTVQRRTAA